MGNDKLLTAHDFIKNKENVEALYPCGTSNWQFRELKMFIARFSIKNKPSCNEVNVGDFQ